MEDASIVFSSISKYVLVALVEVKWMKCEHSAS